MIRSAIIILSVFSLLGGTASGDTGAWRKYLNSNYIVSMAMKGDTIWCATDGGLVKWNRVDGKSVLYTRDNGLVSNQLYYVASDSGGTPWITYSSQENRSIVSTIGNDRAQLFDTSSSGIEGNRLRSIHFDANGNIWFGCVWGGVIKYDGTSWTTYLPEEIFTASPRSLTSTDSGIIWIATNDGAWSFDGENWRRYSTGDGLPGNNVTDIDIDNNGDIWFATTNGISVYDGHAWKTYTKKDGLINNNVTTMTISSDGVKWFGTDYGLSRFDGINWTTFTEKNELVSNKVTAIVEDAAHNIWVCSRDAGKGVAMFNGSVWTWYTIWMTDSKLPSNRVYAVAAEKTGAIWFATEKGLARLDGSSWTIYTVANGLKSNNISEIYIDDDNTKWFVYNRYDHKGVTRYDGTSWTTYSKDSGLASDAVTTVLRAKDGTLYFGTIAGLTIYNGLSWRHYPDNNRLASRDVFAIDSDKNGILWFGTSKGLSRFDGSIWKTFISDDQLLNDLIRVAVSPDGTIWALSSFGGLVRLIGDDYSPITITPDSLSTMMESSAVEGEIEYKVEDFALDSDGGLWAVMKEGVEFDETMNTWKCILWHFDGTGWSQHCMTTETPFDTVTGIQIDDRGDIWLATNVGLRRYNEKGGDTFLIDGPAGNSISDIVVDNNNGKTIATDRGVSFFTGALWKNIRGSARRSVAYDRNGLLWLTDNYGVLQYDGINWNFIEKIGEDSIYQTLCYARDGNAMWIGTTIGLWRFDGNGGWKYFGDKNGGVSNVIKDIAIDRNGYLWMTVGIASSVWRFDGAESKRYTSGDGLAYDRANVVVVDNDNKKWIGTLKGLSCYNDTTWTTYGKKDGLPSDNITALALDNNNRLWVGTDAGVARQNAMSWEIFTDADGLVDNMVLSIEVDKNNVVWIGTQYGLSSFDERGILAHVDKITPIKLFGSFPNPFNAETVIEFDLLSWGNLSLDIYNIAGQKVRSLSFPAMTAGHKKILWNGRSDDGAPVSSGPYFYRIHRGGHTADGRMMLVK